MKKILFILFGLTLALVGCTSMKVTELDKDGYFPSTGRATVVMSKPINLDSRRQLVFVGTSKFVQGQLENLHYFNEVITLDDLESRIIKANLTDKISSINDKIGVNNAAKYYRPFLWLRYNTRQDGSTKYSQFILTDAATMEDYFITETQLDYAWRGVNDQNNWYPMFNALIDYMKQNSRSYGKS